MIFANLASACQCLGCGWRSPRANERGVGLRDFESLRDFRILIVTRDSLALASQPPLLAALLSRDEHALLEEIVRRHVVKSRPLS